MQCFNDVSVLFQTLCTAVTFDYVVIKINIFYRILFLFDLCHFMKSFFISLFVRG